MDKLAIDRVAMSASALCAVHCAVVPMIACFLPPLISVLVSDAIFHAAMLLFVVPCGIISIVVSCGKHRKYSIGATLAVGMGTLILAMLTETYEHPLSIMAGVVLCYGHYRNYVECRKVKCSHGE